MFYVVRVLYTENLSPEHEYLHVDSSGIISWGPQSHMHLFPDDISAEIVAKTYNQLYKCECCYIDSLNDEDYVVDTCSVNPFADA